MSAETLSVTFTRARVECGAVTLNVATIGDGRPVIFLHGFPEHWRAFAPMMAALSDQFTCIAPDQRGYGTSDRPRATHDYAINHLADDIAGLIAALGYTCVDIIAHDWGGLVAWHLAHRYPDLTRRIVIFNAPHPFCLQRALDTDPSQRTASRYAQEFAKQGSHKALIAQGSSALWDTFFGADYANGWLNDDDRAAQIAAWDQDGAWEAMLNWYRAADFDYDGNSGAARPRLEATLAPILLVWGDKDRIFAPSALA